MYKNITKKLNLNVFYDTSVELNLLLDKTEETNISLLKDTNIDVIDINNEGDLEKYLLDSIKR